MAFGEDEADPVPAPVHLARELRQRLDSLRRAGVTGLPRIERPEPRPRARPSPAAPRDVVQERPQVAATAPEAPQAAPRPAPTSPAPAREIQPAPPAPPPTAPSRGMVSSLFDDAGFDTPPIPEAERSAILHALSCQVAECVKCPHLARTRNKTVFADGSPTARLMFVGEAPGADEDRTGVPFVGRAGQLLTDMITKGMRLRREDVYIANILKCRPPENRDPTPEESANCMPYLERQIEIVRPGFLCLLGRTAVQGLLGTSLSMARLRGKWYRYRGIPTVVTYHPSYLLRNPAAKKDAWEDLQLLMNAMGLSIPQRGKGGA